MRAPLPGKIMSMIGAILVGALPLRGGSIVEIDGPDAVKRAFNDSKGKPRIVLLLSPT